SGRAGASAPRGARPRRAPGGRLSPVAHDRGRGELVQGPRAPAARAALAAHPGLSRAARGLPRPGRGREVAARSASGRPAPGHGLGSRRRVSRLRLRLNRALRFSTLALTRAQAARALIAERQALITDLDRARDAYLASTRGSSF